MNPPLLFAIRVVLFSVTLFQYTVCLKGIIIEVQVKQSVQYFIKATKYCPQLSSFIFFNRAVWPTFTEIRIVTISHS